MTETEKQEGQKTVVAFITGLLIGGLLVWIFSSSPKTEPVIEPLTDTTQDQTVATTSDNTADGTNKVDTNTQPTPVSVGDSFIKVADQKAGALVILSDITYPQTTGWVVVRDFLDGNPGNVLGAARYSTNDGLNSKEVNLLRNTVASSSYQVVFYTDNGDKVFDLKDDKLIDGVSATFKAE